MMNPDDARDELVEDRGFDDGWYLRRPRSDHPTYLSRYNAGYDARVEVEEAMAQAMAAPIPRPKEPDPMDPRLHGDSADHEEHFLGSITGRRALERACNEGEF